MNGLSLEGFKVLTMPIDLGGIWHYGWAVGLIACLIVYFLASKQTRDFTSVALVYFIARGIWLLEAPRLPFGDLTRAFQATAGQSVAAVLLTACGAVGFAFHRPKWIKPMLTALVVVELAAVWTMRAGVMGWESFDLALVALCIPMIRGNFWITLAAALTIITHHCATALLILVAEMACVSFGDALVLCAGGLALAYYHSHGAWLDGLERMHTWASFLSVWETDWTNQAIGSGAGSFMWINLLVTKFKEPIFLQMHSDWLQLYVEYGVVGVTVFLLAAQELVSQSWEDKTLRASLFGAGAFMLTYYPLHMFPSAFVIALFAALAYKNKSA